MHSLPDTFYLFKEHLMHRSDVLLQVTLERRPKGTLRTGEGLLASVHQEMASDVRSSQEPLAAHQTMLPSAVCSPSVGSAPRPRYGQTEVVRRQRRRSGARRGRPVFHLKRGERLYHSVNVYLPLFL